MPYDQLHPDTRAAVIVNVARQWGLSDDEIHTVAQDAIDGPDQIWPLPTAKPRAAAHLLRTVIRSSYAGDDDFDDLRHELDHLLGHCTDDDPHCRLRDDDE